MAREDEQVRPVDADEPTIPEAALKHPMWIVGLGGGARELMALRASEDGAKSEESEGDGGEG